MPDSISFAKAVARTITFFTDRSHAVSLHLEAQTRRIECSRCGLFARVFRDDGSAAIHPDVEMPCAA